MSRYAVAEDRAGQLSRFLMLDTTTPPLSLQTMQRQTSPETYCSSLNSGNSSLSSSPTTLYANPSRQPCSSNSASSAAAMSEYSLSRTHHSSPYQHYSSSSRRTSAFSPPTLAISPIPEHGALDIPYDASSSSRRTSTADEENVNYDIKMHLTDLLNCETVRQDSRMRLWVQARLMEAELELKRQRRRRGRVASLPVTAVAGTVERDDAERRCSS